MEQALENLFRTLHLLIGHHRKMLEVVRSEYEAFLSAEVKNIQESTYNKEALIHSIQQVEAERRKAAASLAPFFNLSEETLTLGNIILAVQGRDLKKADQLRSALNTLVLLIGRIKEQNNTNAQLVEKSLNHVSQMKKNLAGTVTAGSLTYTHNGQKAKAFREKGIISEKV